MPMPMPMLMGKVCRYIFLARNSQLGLHMKRVSIRFTYTSTTTTHTNHTMSDSESQRSASASPELTEKKRKRPIVAPEDELEIDINLPEPASKKAKRKEKKEKKEKKAKAENGEPEETVKPTTAEPPAPGQRSEYGIWIGNLPWSATKDTLRTWFEDQGIDYKSITRLHMPAPPEEKGPSRPGFKPLNKGFAYVDFLGLPELELALALSEKLMGGRKVLIKNAKSFEGRPTVTEAEQAKKAAAAPDGKEPTQRIFIGNLGFDVTKDDLMEHFSQAGTIEDIHMATFQDTGKCKGFAWVRFHDMESAAAAVRGYIFKSGGEDDDDEDGEEEDGAEEEEEEEEGDKKKSGKSKSKKKKEKKRKWFINRLAGRPVRVEFAEDAQTRYKKRYGSKPAAPEGGNAPRHSGPRPSWGGRGEEQSGEGAPAPDRRNPRKMDADARQAMRRQKHIDARNVAPGQALANAQRASTAIVKPSGKKTTFD
jgi:RNA recognition motif-containing protein